MDLVIGKEMDEIMNMETTSPRRKYSAIKHQEIGNEWLYEMIRIMMYSLTVALSNWKYIGIGLTTMMIAVWAVKLIMREKRRPVGRCWNCGESFRLTRRQIDLGWKCPTTGCNAFNTAHHSSLTGRTLKSIFMRFSIYSFTLLQSAHLLFLLMGSETSRLIIGTSFEKSENKLFVVEFIMLIFSVVGCILNGHSIGFSFLLGVMSFLSSKCRLALKGVLLFSNISITVLKIIKLNEVQMDMGDEYDYERYLEERKLINRYNSHQVVQSLEIEDHFQPIQEAENTAESTGYVLTMDHQPSNDTTSAIQDDFNEIENVDLSQLSLSGEMNKSTSNENVSPWSRDDHLYYKPPKYAKSHQELVQFSKHMNGTGGTSSNSKETTKPKAEVDTISMLSALTISDEEDENMHDIPDISSSISSSESPPRQLSLNSEQSKPPSNASVVMGIEQEDRPSSPASLVVQQKLSNIPSSLSKYQAIGITFFMFSLTAVLAATLMNMYQISNYT
ncbi:hypothetical protein C9374_005201 [Naegleria lovaniensis]|uniref:Uncharacterized protein n=1 Tax=Naegleria lovaniensis TaxID=51637 RepID=A0AA88GKG1_NAELO|nr:uncharacterized protein C9374_005201 [Naegleria lovaniensis]KAG2382621.1 hypothetical protein C9374_005201 [Naegleria lovaniensis]